MQAKKFYSRTIIIFSFLIFTALSFILFLIAPAAGHFEVDSPAYQVIAENFYYHNSLLDPHNITSAPVFPLGYPLFMGLLYKLFGTHYAVVIWAQVLLSLATLFLVFRIARLLFDIRTAYIAVGLMAINCAFLIYSQMMLSEVLLAFFLTFFFERLLLFLHTNKISYLAQAGFLLSCSVLIKSIALFYIVILVLVLWFRNKNIQSLAILCTAFILPLGLYMLRNYYVYGAYAFTPQAHVNMYHYFLPKVVAQVKGISFIQARNSIPFTGTHSLDTSGWQQAWQMLCDYFIKHPFTFVYIWVQNMCKTLFGLFTTQLKVLLNPAIKGGICSFNLMPGNIFARMYNYITFGTHSNFVIVLGFLEAIWLLIRYLLVLIAFFILYQKEQYTELILFGSFIFLCTFITGFDGCFRFRIAFETLLTVLAAVSLSKRCKKGCVVFGA